MEHSSRTSLTLAWSSVTPTLSQSPGGDILGYILYATDPEAGNTWVAFNGTALGLRDQVQATVSNLTMGQSYTFQVAAHSHNGEGTRSAAFEFWSCILSTGFAAPTRTGSSALTMALTWTTPTDTGGCAITGYAVFMDDGTGSGTFSEVNTANDPAFRS
jgi:hypothetical protein